MDRGIHLPMVIFFSWKLFYDFCSQWIDKMLMFRDQITYWNLNVSWDLWHTEAYTWHEEGWLFERIRWNMTSSFSVAVDDKREAYIWLHMLQFWGCTCLFLCKHIEKKIIEEILGKQSFEVKPFIDAVSIVKVRFDSLTNLLL